MLNIEIIKFEAQDVITASCICNKGFEKYAHGVMPDGTHYIVLEDANGELYPKECPADKHDKCPPAVG